MSDQITKSRLWTARVMSAIVILFMLFDSIFKFIQPQEVIQTTLQLGYMEHHIAIIGLLGFISIVLFTIPRTSFLGVVLLTGFWGGAIATNFRLDYPLFSHTLFPVYLALLAWGSLWLKNSELRKLFLVNRKGNS